MAATTLEHVLERRPQHFDAVVYSGVLEHDLGGPTARRRPLAGAALRPDAFLPAFALGAIYAGTGQLAKAETLLKGPSRSRRTRRHSLSSGRSPTRGAASGTRSTPSRGRSSSTRTTRTGSSSSVSATSTAGGTQKAAERFRAALEAEPEPGSELHEAKKLLGPAGAGPLPGLPARRPTGPGARRALAAEGPAEGARSLSPRTQGGPRRPRLCRSPSPSSARPSDGRSRRWRRRGGSRPSPRSRSPRPPGPRSSKRSAPRESSARDACGEMLEVVTSNFARSIGDLQRAAARAEMGEQPDEALEDEERALRLSPRDMRQFPLAAKGWPSTNGRSSSARWNASLARPSWGLDRPCTPRPRLPGRRGCESGAKSIRPSQASRGAFDRAPRRPGGPDARADPAEPAAHRKGLEPTRATQEPDELSRPAGTGRAEEKFGSPAGIENRTRRFYFFADFA